MPRRCPAPSQFNHNAGYEGERKHIPADTERGTVQMRKEAHTSGY